MVILDKNRVYTNEDITFVENKLLGDILAVRTPEGVESSITYARFLSKTGLTNENYPLFIKVLEIGNHYVVDALVGDRDPFLFLSSIQPNRMIAQAMFALLAERHPGGMYPKTLSVILGVIQALYNNPMDGYEIYSLSVSDLNSLGKHLDEEKGQEDSLNRVILDILDKVAQLNGLDAENEKVEEIAIHAARIRNNFFDANKVLKDVIPEVLLVRMRYQDFEEAPREEVAYKDDPSKAPTGPTSVPKAGEVGKPAQPKAAEKEAPKAAPKAAPQAAPKAAPKPAPKPDA